MKFLTLKKINSREGFTLIEMLVVIGIIGVLASLVLVGLGPARESSRDARRISNLNQIRNLLEVYYLKNNGYPANLSSLGDKYVSLVGEEAAIYGYTKTGTGYYLGVDTEGNQLGSVKTGTAGEVQCNQDYCVSSD